MPIEFANARGGAVAIAHCFGELSEADILASLDFAFGSGHFAPHRDRMVTVDPVAALEALEFETLKRIQRRVVAQETRGGGGVRFRSVLVHATEAQRGIMQLYKAIWESGDFPGVTFHIVASEDAAWRILDRAASEDHPGRNPLSDGPGEEA